MIKRAILIIAAVCGFVVTTPLPATAASVPTPLTQFAVCGAGVADVLGLTPWWQCLQQKNGGIFLKEYGDIWLVAIPVLDDIIKIGGYVAVGFIIWGGIKYIKSQGEPRELAEAKSTILNAVIGLIICMFSVAIVQFIYLGLV